MFNVIFLQISPVGEALAAFLALAGLLASLFFVYMFTKRLGIFAKSRIENWHQEFALTTPGLGLPTIGAGTSNSAPVDRPLRWVTKTEQAFRYERWNEKLPMVRQVHEQLLELAHNTEPVHGLLKSSDPPTLKRTDEGRLFPIAEEMEVIESFENLEALPENTRRRIIGTFHTHQHNLEISESCREKLIRVDLTLGRKVHCILSPRGMALYRAVDGSAKHNRGTILEER